MFDICFFSKRLARGRSLENELPQSPTVEDRNHMKPHSSQNGDSKCAFNNMNKTPVSPFYRPCLILKSIKGGTVGIAPASTWPARPSPACVGEGLVGGARQGTA